MKNFALNSWGYPKNLLVSEIGTNIFQFGFEKSTDLERVLYRRPWSFDNQLLLLRKWKESIEEDE